MSNCIYLFAFVFIIQSIGYIYIKINKTIVPPYSVRYTIIYDLQVPIHYLNTPNKY